MCLNEDRGEDTLLACIPGIPFVVPHMLYYNNQPVYSRAITAFIGYTNPIYNTVSCIYRDYRRSCFVLFSVFIFIFPGPRIAIVRFSNRSSFGAKVLTTSTMTVVLKALLLQRTSGPLNARAYKSRPVKKYIAGGSMVLGLFGRCRRCVRPRSPSLSLLLFAKLMNKCRKNKTRKENGRKEVDKEWRVES